MAPSNKKRKKKQRDNDFHIDSQRLAPSAKLLHLRVNLIKKEAIAKLREAFQAEKPLVKAMTLSLGFKKYKNDDLLEILKVLPKSLHGLRVRAHFGYMFDDGFWREFCAGRENQLVYLEVGQMSDTAMRHLGNHLGTNLKALRVNNLEDLETLDDFDRDRIEDQVSSVTTFLLDHQEPMAGGCSSEDEIPYFAWAKKFPNLTILNLGFERPIFCHDLYCHSINFGLLATNLKSLETFCMNIEFLSDEKEELEPSIEETQPFGKRLKRFCIKAISTSCLRHDEAPTASHLIALGRFLNYSLNCGGEDYDIDNNRCTWTKCRTRPDPGHYYLKLESIQSPEKMSRPAWFSCKDNRSQDWVQEKLANVADAETDDKHDSLTMDCLGEVIDETLLWSLEDLNHSGETKLDPKLGIGDDEVQELLELGDETRTKIGGVKKELKVELVKLEEKEINELIAIGQPIKEEKIEIKEEPMDL